MNISAPTLFENDPRRGRARATDPQTSVDAAPNTRGVRAEVLTAFYQHGRLSATQLCGVLTDRLPGSVITARSALKADGLIVETGAFRVNRRSRREVVWTLTPQGREKAAAAARHIVDEGIR